MKKKMLVISRFCPSDSARYAGSKTHNFYLKKLHKDFEVKLISFAAPGECPKPDLGDYGIDHDVSEVDGGRRNIPLFLLYNWWNAPNYFGKTLGLINGYLKHILVRKLRKLRKSGYVPDIILLEWTQILLMARHIRRIYPSPYFIASEHDVTFLRIGRQFEAARGFARLRERVRYKSIYKAELRALAGVDLIAPHNSADRDLLVRHGVSRDKIHVIAPFVSDFSEVTYHPRGRQILFYGAMDREDNYKSVVWFLESVFLPLLLPSYSMCILGGHPHPSLDKYKSERVTIAGFVPDIRQYLGTSLCTVVPLLFGAGIKVKVLEAMGAGLPVLANSIAMEGIGATRGEHYLHCEQPLDYKAAFDAMDAGKIDLALLSKNARRFIAENFNLETSYLSYKTRILALANGSLQ